LQKKAKIKNTNLNNQVSNILHDYNDTYSYLEELHYIWNSPSLLKLLLKNLHEEDIQKSVAEYKQDLKKQVLYCNGSISSSADVLTTIEGICKLQGMPFTSKKNSLEETVTIIHSLGEQWGIINQQTIESLINLTNSKIKNFNTNTTHFTFTIIKR
jgi:hypothetical protein